MGRAGHFKGLTMNMRVRCYACRRRNDVPVNFSVNVTTVLEMLNAVVNCESCGSRHLSVEISAQGRGLNSEFPPCPICDEVGCDGSVHLVEIEENRI